MRGSKDASGGGHQQEKQAPDSAVLSVRKQRTVCSSLNWTQTATISSEMNHAVLPYSVHDSDFTSAPIEGRAKEGTRLLSSRKVGTRSRRVTLHLQG